MSKKTPAKKEETKEPIKTKVARAKQPTPKKSTAKLISYKIGGVIKTGDFSDFRPEICVEAQTLEEAKDFVVPHLKELFNDLYYFSTRKVTIAKVEVKEITPNLESAKELANKLGLNEPTAPVPGGTPITVNGKETGMTTPTKEDMAPFNKKPTVTVVEPMADVSVPFQKAKKAIESCTTLEALDVVQGQVSKSTKLTEAEKDPLMVMLINKIKELNK